MLSRVAAPYVVIGPARIRANHEQIAGLPLVAMPDPRRDHHNIPSPHRHNPASGTAEPDLDLAAASFPGITGSHASRCHPAPIRTERHRGNPCLVAAEDQHLPAGGGVPDSNRMVFGRRYDSLRAGTPSDARNPEIVSFQHANCRIFRRARDLLDRKLSRHGIEQSQIGMSAAHIDAEAVPVRLCGHHLVQRVGRRT